MSRLNGYITLITGAGRGIGAALALSYAREGAKVVVVDLNESNAHSVAEQVRGLGVETDSFVVDVREPAQCGEMVARVVERFGRLDVLVNNAGVIRVRSFLNTTPEDWDFIQSVNTRGVFFATQAAARHMMEQAPLGEKRPRGKVINIASIAGRNGRPMLSAYAASKAAVISITQAAAQEFAPHLTVNAICPGAIGTDMWRQIDREWSALRQVPPGSVWEERVRGVPMKRAQTPEDLTGMATFLASADADFVTGQSYNVDGGLAMN